MLKTSRSPLYASLQDEVHLSRRPLAPVTRPPPGRTLCGRRHRLWCARAFAAQSQSCDASSCREAVRLLARIVEAGGVAHHMRQGWHEASGGGLVVRGVILHHHYVGQVGSAVVLLQAKIGNFDSVSCKLTVLVTL